MRILVFNCGSSSLKFELIEIQPLAGQQPKNVRKVASGTFEEIGPEGSFRMTDQSGHKLERSEFIADHKAAALRAMEWLDQIGNTTFDAIAHRIVHGGEQVIEPAIVTDKILGALTDASRFAPLHNPPAISVVQTAGEKLPGTLAVVVTDTGFHHTLPEAASKYAIPHALADRHGIRRFGFHGIGHAWMLERCVAMQGISADRINLITLQLGAGCSATAIRHGQSIDTSMGLTPLEGLMMSTRSGDIDPAIFPFLAACEKLSPDQVERILNHQSGLLGISGISSDLRKIEAAAEDDHQASLAIEMFCYRVRKYIGAYMAVLGHTDGVVFGGGIGEHSDLVREKVCGGLEPLGVMIDRTRNRECNGREACISAKESPVGVYVIPLDEELFIARAAARLLAESGHKSL